MLERTAAAATEAGLKNVETLEAEMEAIPLADESVDHVISNSAINLSARKRRPRRVRARAHPGGKLSLGPYCRRRGLRPRSSCTRPPGPAEWPER